MAAAAFTAEEPSPGVWTYCHGRISASNLEAYPWNMWLDLDVASEKSLFLTLNVQAELEEIVSELERMSAAELSTVRDHHSHEVSALQDRLKMQHEEHEQQMICLTARHAKEVCLDSSLGIAQFKPQSESRMLKAHRPN